MSKRVLIISSSPRKGGNSDLLCDEFMRGAFSAGHEVHKVRLSDLEINYCRGCGVCNNTGECVIQDDAARILAEMLASEVIVLATPVYFYTMSAQLKTLIDRTASIYTRLKNKDFYFIVAAADDVREHMERVISSLRGFTVDCLEGACEKGIIYGVGLYNRGEVTQAPELLKQAYDMGSKL